MTPTELAAFIAAIPWKPAPAALAGLTGWQQVDGRAVASWGEPGGSNPHVAYIRQPWVLTTPGTHSTLTVGKLFAQCNIDKLLHISTGTTTKPRTANGQIQSYTAVTIRGLVTGRIANTKNTHLDGLFLAINHDPALTPTVIVEDWIVFDTAPLGGRPDLSYSGVMPLLMEGPSPLGPVVFNRVASLGNVDRPMSINAATRFTKGVWLNDCTSRFYFNGKGQNGLSPITVYLTGRTDPAMVTSGDGAPPLNIVRSAPPWAVAVTLSPVSLIPAVFGTVAPTPTPTPAPDPAALQRRIDELTAANAMLTADAAALHKERNAAQALANQRRAQLDAAAAALTRAGAAVAEAQQAVRT
jgi:hypothetical protein